MSPTTLKSVIFAITSFFFISNPGWAEETFLPYNIVDTGVVKFYNNTSVITKPKPGEPFYGQDAHYQLNTPSYAENGDGTITDKVTGLMWQQKVGEKKSFAEGLRQAKKLKLGGYTDWRVPTIKELYSLINFTGTVRGRKAIRPFIDTRYFEQPFGNTGQGEREIDAQTWSATEYVGRTMRNDETVFGVNFVDGRIKGYPKFNPRSRKPNTMYFRFVRGNINYGKNEFTDNGDGTVSDLATGLMWQKSDSGRGLDWRSALKYAENMHLAGHKDWRLPNAKELQSIVDYSRSPQTTRSPAIDPLFEVTAVQDPRGGKQYPYFWTSTTHLDGRNPYDSAVYIAFGEALGRMHGRIMDVHGAGAQRSDPKSGSAREYPDSFGPQGDLRYVFNYVRCVRTIH